MLTHLAGPYVVGADAGGTKTRCTVMTLTGAIAGSGYAPGANPNSGGDTAGSLTTALGAALGDIDPALVIAGVFGIAGAGAAGRPAAVRAAGVPRGKHEGHEGVTKHTKGRSAPGQSQGPGR